MLRPLVALSALIALTLPAAAQQMKWHNQATEESAALIFGVPDTEEILLFFVCQPGSDPLTAQSQIGSRGLERDANARLILSAGRVKKTLDGKAVGHDSNNNVDVEAPLKLADLKTLLKGGPSLSVEVKGAKQKISLSGVDEALAKFEAACKPGN